MEKHTKHDPPLGNSSINNINLKDTKNSSSSSTSSLTAAATASAGHNSMNRINENPLIKFQGCKWEQVFDFDKMLKQIRNAERHYLRGSHDYHYGPVGSSNGKTSSGKYPIREQPQVQRLNANDMHFYGMVPKQPFDVVVCDICLGIYTKMGFNNHMKIHHPQAWNLVSTKSSIPKDTGHNLNASGQGHAGDNHSENVRTLNASANPLAESTSHAATTISSVNNSRHKSSKSGGGSSGGSSRSRSKSKHHHHHQQPQQQQQQQQQQHTSSTSSITTHTTQASTTNTEVSTHHTNSKSSKKNSSTLSSSIETKVNTLPTVPKEIPQPDSIQPITIFSSSSSNSSCSLPPTPKMVNAEVSGTLQDAPFPPINPVAVVKEKSKASKRKSKSSSSTASSATVAVSIPVAPVTYAAPEVNESSNSSLEYTTVVSNASSSKSTSKRSSKPKIGKDLKQIMEPQLSELDQAVSSITDGQRDAINEISNSNDINIGSTTLNTCSNPMGYNTEETALSTQVPLPTARQQQQQHLQGQYTPMPIMPESINNAHQQPQLQQQNSNSEDNDNSMLTFDDMLDSKFINEILNTDESVIHFDENELDKAALQQQHQQQQHTFIQQAPNKRMRYDDQIGNGVNVEVGGHQSTLTGKYSAFQQQHQHQQQQQAFQVTNLDDIKMYTTAIDPQQYLSQTQQQQHTQEQHQITTIDPMQLQQLLYNQQQQQQQGLNPYAVNGGMDDMSAVAAATGMEQQQYSDSDVIMCSAEQLHKEGKINAADYATLAALSGNNNAYSNVCDVNAMAAAAQFQVYNIPSLTDDDMTEDNNKVCSLPANDVIPQNHYVLPADGNDDEQLFYAFTPNNQVAVISQQRQQQMIAEFLTQAGYDSVDNVNMNNPTVVGNANVNEAMDIKSTAFDSELSNELLDFDFSRLETVTSCVSSNSGSSSSENKANIKTESNSNDKYIQSSAISDDLFLNLFLYAGLPRPLAVNCFGLIKLPQAVATTFRKNLHTTRKANNSPVSLNGGGGATSATRFSASSTNTKSTSAQNYFTTLGAGGNANNSQMNEFSIGSITITNQTSGNSNLSLQQQQQQLTGQKHGLMPVEVSFNASNANGLIAANTSSPSPPTTSLGRSSRPKSAGSANANTQSKQRSSSISQSSAATSPIPHSSSKTVFVNNSQADQSKFVKRSLISRTNLPARNFPNFTAKQLSDLFLHPTKDSKEKYLQLLAARDQDKDPSVGSILEQQRMNNVKSFYERRKRLLNTTTTAANSSGYNHVRQRNSQQVPTASATALLRQRLMRTLSDCGINSIKSNNNSANSSSNNDILRVFA